MTSLNSTYNKEQKIMVLSLFSGAGGLDHGFFMNHKFEVSFALDYDNAAARTYSMNHKFALARIENGGAAARGTFALEDIKKINMRKLSSLNPSVVIGGPPCQDFSMIRGPDSERRGIAEARGRLYAYFVKALINLNPHFFVFENVPGLVFQDKRAAFRIIKDDFTNLTSNVEKIEEITGNGFSGTANGYNLLYSKLVDSSVFGVPQRRQRLIILGARKDIVDRSIEDLELTKEAVQSALNPRNSIFNKFPVSAIEAFSGKIIPELEEEYKEITDDWKKALSGRKARFIKWTKGGLNFSGDIVNDYIFSNGVKKWTKKELERAWSEHKKVLVELKYYHRPLDDTSDFDDSSNNIPLETKGVKERMKNIPPGENYSFVNNTKFQVKGNDISLVYRRLHPLKPAYTVLARGGGGTHGYHYLRARSGLTNRERARLQSFPDTFRFNGTASEQRMQIGEAVPPLLGKAVSNAVAGLYERFSLNISNSP